MTIMSGRTLAARGTVDDQVFSRAPRRLHGVSSSEGDTRVRLERLTFVHHGDQGTIGRLIAEGRGVLRFGADGSGLIEVQAGARANVADSGAVRPSAVSPSEATVPIHAVAFSALPAEVQAELGEDHVPCILG